MGKRRGRFIKEQVQRTHGKSQRWIGLRVGGRGGWGRGGWWRESGDNYAGTTIKKKRKD